MENYAKAFRVTLIISITMFVLAAFFHYGLQGDNAVFWCNVCLGVFGSSLLTCVASYIGYKVSKKDTLYSFYQQTNGILNYINRYRIDWSIENKIFFFLNYADMDKYTWDSLFGEIYFLNQNKSKREYIYERIYLPINALTQKTLEYTLHFRWYTDGTVKNESVMVSFIHSIESLFIECKIITIENTRGTWSQNKLVHAIREELNNKYFDLINDKHGTWKVRFLPWKR